MKQFYSEIIHYNNKSLFKSSLLLGLIGEMRKVKGTVKFGGRVSYCSQSAWIQNATLVR